MKNLKVGNVEAQSGKLAFGAIPVLELQDGTKVDIPVMVARGVEDGPTLLVNALTHGPEIPGIEVIRRVMRLELDPKSLKGTVIAIPIANPLAVQHCKYGSYQDDLQMDRTFPGNSKGSMTQRLACALWEEAALQADYILDLHCNSAPAMPLAVMHPGKNRQTEVKAENMANAFGIPIVYIPAELMSHGLLTNTAMAHGIPALNMELVGTRRLEPKYVEIGVKGVLNVMKWLGMIDGVVEKQTGFPKPEGPLEFKGLITANRGGLVHWLEAPGEFIAKGSTIVRIYNAYGDEVETIRMPFNGYVWAYPCSYHGYQLVATGDLIAFTFGAPSEKGMRLIPQP
jgi:predicted deacylase